MSVADCRAAGRRMRRRYRHPRVRTAAEAIVAEKKRADERRVVKKK
jgi:hypothetical protein